MKERTYQIIMIESDSIEVERLQKKFMSKVYDLANEYGVEVVSQQ